MKTSCCHHDSCHAPDPQRGNPTYRRVLWLVLAINTVMFAVEVIAGVMAGSASLQADALDFLGDAGNYAISLFVVDMALRYRASAALFKGGTMAAFGLWVIGAAAWHAWHGTLPQAFTMGAVGFAALAANAASFGLFWAHRGGDANMRSAWICTRNDVLGNMAVLLAALRRMQCPAGASLSTRTNIAMPAILPMFMIPPTKLASLSNWTVIGAKMGSSSCPVRRSDLRDHRAVSARRRRLV